MWSVGRRSVCAYRLYARCLWHEQRCRSYGMRLVALYKCYILFLCLHLRQPHRFSFSKQDQHLTPFLHWDCTQHSELHCEFIKPLPIAFVDLVSFLLSWQMCFVVGTEWQMTSTIVTEADIGSLHWNICYHLVSMNPSHGHNTCSSLYVALIKPSSSLRVTHRSFRHVSPHLWNQLPTLLRFPHPNYLSPSQRPSCEHAGLTCYTLLSPLSLFHCFSLTYLFKKYPPPPVSP